MLCSAFNVFGRLTHKRQQARGLGSQNLVGEIVANLRDASVPLVTSHRAPNFQNDVFQRSISVKAEQAKEVKDGFLAFSETGLTGRRHDTSSLL